MGSLWQEFDREELLRRVARLTPESTPLWGRFTSCRMLAHVNDTLRMATGDLPVAFKRTPLRYPGIKHLVIYALPFPRGVPTAPELLARTDAAEFARERDQFPMLLQRFAARPRAGPWPDHPAFGPMSGSAWGVLTWRHIGHHFTQFGI